MDPKTLANTLVERARYRRRLMVAVAGPPGSGKSTLAAELAEALARCGETAAVVPMDGFHFDDAVLKAKGLSERKGAPETFDFAGLHTLLQRLRACEPEVAIPLFDRSMELSRAAAAIVEAHTRIVLVEGNYLLLDEAPWNTLSGLFDVSVFLDVPRAELERRLLARWHAHGRSSEAARHWVETNDLPNADRVLSHRLTADIVL
ncbi:nucleoside triphosphate hydrolase [Chelativorans intermedius]|uniref:Nucleoside triphosphate hydrolase n=1 Tax=Chelativorans intermedius TaxID=515947 RepID=A0ABV6DBC5_9HYPH|nr:nucleoside triphosphate hydrolase [Chelativorans intermedius]MCT8999191.1 nucleoside triphosphate hydrolase [Chelativorans intermedius]